jgi:hypothetical protein
MILLHVRLGREVKLEAEHRLIVSEARDSFLDWYGPQLMMTGDGWRTRLEACAKVSTCPFIPAPNVAPWAFTETVENEGCLTCSPDHPGEFSGSDLPVLPAPAGQVPPILLRSTQSAQRHLHIKSSALQDVRVTWTLLAPRLGGFNGWRALPVWDRTRDKKPMRGIRPTFSKCAPLANFPGTAVAGGGSDRIPHHNAIGQCRFRQQAVGADGNRASQLTRAWIGW